MTITIDKKGGLFAVAFCHEGRIETKAYGMTANEAQRFYNAAALAFEFAGIKVTLEASISFYEEYK